ncbi:MAG: hypothetical protein DLD55_05030 [candidate division SR1 bacterium]|nr:MAG: hypothetical protein DLD55_05030 [candidate division SR1 bacterium]
MEIRKLRKDFSQLISTKSKGLFSFSKEQELKAVESELKAIAPATKNTLFTLIRNSELKKKILLPQQDELCAQITSFAYLAPEKRPYQIGDFYLEPSYNTLFHCIYLNHKEKICIIAYRGTDAKEKADLLSDAQIILGVNAIDPRVGGSLQLFDQVRKSHPEYKKWICGHSLGGTLCYIVAKHRKVDYCCTFNPGSAPNKIFILMLRDTLLKKAWTQKIHTYKIIGDPISLFSYVGETTSFFVPKWNPLELHAMKNFL